MKAAKLAIVILVLLILIPVVWILPSIINGQTKFLIVLSESMVPTMMIGDAMIFKYTPPEELKVGDIIAFKIDNKTVVSHRVIDIKKIDIKNAEDSDGFIFQTKGDNVKTKDPFVVDSHNVIGKAVFKIPYIGYLSRSPKKPILFILFTIIPSIMIIVDEIKKMSKSPIQIRLMEIEEKKRKRKENIEIKRINYKRVGIIVLSITILLFAMRFPYVDPVFWLNLINKNGMVTYLVSIMAYIIIQAGILLILSPLWVQNKYRNKGHKRNILKDIKKELNKQFTIIRKIKRRMTNNSLG